MAFRSHDFIETEERPVAAKGTKISEPLIRYFPTGTEKDYKSRSKTTSSMTYNTYQRSAAVSKSIGTNSSIIKTVILLCGDNHDSNKHAVVTRSRTLLATAL